MIDTNSIPVIEHAATVTQSALNAWSVVFAMSGGIVVHAYHLIVQGGGLRGIFSNLWSGNTQDKPAIPPIPEAGH